MKTRMRGQLKRSQKVQLCIRLLEYGFYYFIYYKFYILIRYNDMPTLNFF